MALTSLDEWLTHLATQHPQEIHLGLERIQAVYFRLGYQLRPPFTVVTVAGTNGKGSSVAMLESIYRQTGLKVATTTSPHIDRFNERIRVDGQEASDAQIIEAFEVIKFAQQEIFLSYFEYAMLAALIIFHQQQVDIAILEVGLGGRLDAANLVDNDVALITNIGLDHQMFLGDTIEAIAAEKAGIIKPGGEVVFASEYCPGAIVEAAQQNDATLYRAGVEFTSEPSLLKGQFSEIPFLKQNACGVLKVVDILQTKHSVNKAAQTLGLAATKLPARFERKQCNGRQIVFDVAHNLAAAQSLNDALGYITQSKVAVFSMLEDKDIEGVVRALKAQFEHWYVAPLDIERAASGERMLSAFDEGDTMTSFNHLEQSFNCAMAEHPDATIVVFGSFHTVATVKSLLRRQVEIV